MVSEELPQVAIRRVLDDHIKWAVLRAASQQVDYVHVLADHLHHLHLRHQRHHLCVCVALCGNRTRISLTK